MRPDAESPGHTGEDEGPLLALHPALRGVAALLFVAGLVLIVVLLVTVLRPEPPAEQSVVPTIGSPLDILVTALPTGVPEDLTEPLEQVLTSIPLLGTREP